nr:MAG TPA: hypothetical protein [Caudoviricetes sp.]
MIKKLNQMVYFHKCTLFGNAYATKSFVLCEMRVCLCVLGDHLCALFE